MRERKIENEGVLFVGIISLYHPKYIARLDRKERERERESEEKNLELLEVFEVC